MRKINDKLILIFGILLFLLSYKLDPQVNLFFKGVKFPFLDVILSIITEFGVVVLVMLVIPSLILYKKKKKLMYLMILTFISSIILAFVIKLIVLRQRPIEIFTHLNIGIINYPVFSILYYSFPSMHAMVAFSLLPALLNHFKKQKSFWIVFAFLVGLSRIYFGFHFLSDVIFGALFGYFVGDYLLELYEKGKLWK